MWDWLVNKIINHAKKHPYFHLEGYMERYWILKPHKWLPFSIRIHHILRSDDDRHLHNHPWPYISVILSGGYYEITDDGLDVWTKWYGPKSIIKASKDHFHKLMVRNNETVWTLFIMGRYCQKWGFNTEDGFVPWDKYLSKEDVDQYNYEHGKIYTPQIT